MTDEHIAKSLLDHVRRGWEGGATLIARGWIAYQLGILDDPDNGVLNRSATVFITDYGIMDCGDLDEVLAAMSRWAES